MPRDSPAIRLDTSSLKEEKPPTPTLQRETSTRFRPQQLPTPRDVVITQEVEENREKMWDMMSTYLSTDVHDVQQFIVNHVEFTLACSRFNFDHTGAYRAVAYSVRDRLIEFWNDTNQYFHEHDPKRTYYLSIEYLMGRTLQNAVLSLNLEDTYHLALKEMGYALENLYEKEVDAGLGNGGLGRLAACFLDSMATQDYPAWGYGLRYTYGMFRQELHNGYQAEIPDAWLVNGNPWEIKRHDVTYPIRFYGKVTITSKPSGDLEFIWEGGETVVALAYDTPIPGHQTFNTLNLRLWGSQPSNEFDLNSFNEGDYYRALEQKQAAENLTSVLYPNDNTPAGKELRLKQQYFFACATLSDILRRWKHPRAHAPHPIEMLCDKISIQLNDTHPSISIAELQRILIDCEGLSWETAWDIVTKVFSYTNHTVLPEAMETWSIDLMTRLLPRHMQIIYEINHRFMEVVNERFPGDFARHSRMSIIDDAHQKVRMAHLAIVGSHMVNGVAAMHSEIIKNRIFRDFSDLWPHKFTNITNGVTPRRWMVQCNPSLASLLTSKLGSDDWTRKLELLKKLEFLVPQEDFQQRFMAVKRENKERLRSVLLDRTCGELDIDVNALFDIQVKRIHEYKRQLLNILSVIHRYFAIKELSPDERAGVVARVVIFGGKAAPGYHKAKMIIRLITAVGEVVNADKSIGNLLKVVFVPDYNVSKAELLVPAADISQHISTAGYEASGTSNMKFAMNGAPIIGTLDGANVEIREEIGPENIFIFGARADEVNDIRAGGRRPIDGRLFKVLKAIAENKFGHREEFLPLIEPLWHGDDFYLIAHDWPSYLEAQEEVDRAFQNHSRWAKMCILSTLRMGKFSSDRTIKEYADRIWNIQACRLPDLSGDVQFASTTTKDLPEARTPLSTPMRPRASR